MKNNIIFVLIFIIIIGGIFIVFPYLWKFSGGSFLYGGKAIYKGEVLFEAQDDCIVSFTKDMYEIKQICPNQTKVWIDGKLNLK